MFNLPWSVIQQVLGSIWSWRLLIRTQRCSNHGLAAGRQAVLVEPPAPCSERPPTGLQHHGIEGLEGPGWLGGWLMVGFMVR